MTWNEVRLFDVTIMFHGAKSQVCFVSEIKYGSNKGWVHFTTEILLSDNSNSRELLNDINCEFVTSEW